MKNIFDFLGGTLAPHGYCLLWQPELWVTHVVADALIALAYFSIPLALVALVRKRRDLVFGWAFWCFAIFILACGLTHVMGIVTMFYSLYGLEAFVKVLTAGASVATAFLLWPLLPKAVALPSPDKLRVANAELAATIRERDAALAELRSEIASREKAEAALIQSQKLEAVGQLTGGIAHDFNNLLQAVAGNLELIARKPGDGDKVVRWAGSALDAVERGRALTGQLLAFSRRQRMEMAPVPLREMLAGMRELIERAVAPLSTVEIASVDPSLYVRSDPLQLELAILNLAFNARDAMPDGGKLRIAAQLQDDIEPPGLKRGEWVVLSVSDNGTGMDAETLSHAMEPFFTTKEVGAGTGMGLSMAFGVVTQSGGTMKITSEPGEGTIVTLYLRAIEPSHQRPAAGDEAASQWVDLTGRRIVIIDDDDAVRGALTETLETVGATVEQAELPAPGIALVDAAPPDLLIVDFAMPGTTGAEVAADVRSRHADLPILVVTGFADSAKLEAIGKGALPVLRKPFEAKDLIARVAALLEERDKGKG